MAFEWVGSVTTAAMGLAGLAAHVFTSNKAREAQERQSSEQRRQDRIRDLYPEVLFQARTLLWLADPENESVDDGRQPRERVWKMQAQLDAHGSPQTTLLFTRLSNDAMEALVAKLKLEIGDDAIDQDQLAAQCADSWKKASALETSLRDRIRDELQTPPN